MSNHSLTEENLLAALPVALRQDPSFLALAQAIARLLAQRTVENQRLTIYAAIDQLEEPLLDLLAQDFGVSWWDADYSLEEKRQTLKDSWRVHRTLGTKYAVETALSAIYPETRVQEWFEYGGQPYHFKLLIDSTFEHIDPMKHQRVLERTEFYKNLRSHLDAIEYTAIPKGECAAQCLIAATGIGGKLTMEVPIYGLE